MVTSLGTSSFLTDSKSALPQVFLGASVVVCAIGSAMELSMEYAESFAADLKAKDGSRTLDEPMIEMPAPPKPKPKAVFDDSDL